MSKVKVKIAFLGHLPHSIDFDKIKKWKSELFEITGQISAFNINGESDGDEWEFLDDNIESQLPDRDGADVLLAVTYVPLQYKYFVRRFSDNRICMTYHLMADILKFDNIPLENLLLRMLYSVSLVYKLCGNKMPTSEEMRNYTHDETRGCVFDFDGVKSDVVYSLDKPQLCHSCVETLTSNGRHRLENNLVNKVQQELKDIKKGLYYRLADFIKSKPILAIIISSVAAIILGIIGSTLATILWEKIIKHWL